MSKVAYYLQEHLNGEVLATPAARRYFSTDASIFGITPSVIVYPKNENDVRKTARFTWQLAERGRIIPITARGSGTDFTGGALGSGIIMAFPAHMHRILELDEKSGLVVVEPGTNYGKLQQTLQTHGRFLPPYPASIEYSTIGGAVANNAAGEKSVKYGSTRGYVKGLRVVLGNGEVIETKRLNKRECNQKLGLTTFEGEIYRAVDTLLEENQSAVDRLNALEITKNATGYALGEIKRRDGSFDLTPLFVGSQGTLGIITEIALETEPLSRESSVFAAYFDDIQHVQAAIRELRELPDMPSSIELVDEHLLNTAVQTNPNILKGIIAAPFPKFILLVAFDSPGERLQKKLMKKTAKIFERYAKEHQVETEPVQQEQLWRIRQAASVINTIGDQNQRSVPAIGDGVVPLEHLGELLDGIYKMFARNQLPVAVWGHAGDGNLHVQPMLDLSQVGGRQMVFRLLEEYSNLVISLGGSISGEFNDGRLHAPYLEKLYGPEAYTLLQKIKHIFDPYNLLNPGVKVNVQVDDIKPLLRQSYSLEHLLAHMPRS
ncbi:MAG TPA: FAD-binding oxidoreductase [Candidatus Saccharimonadales bacterium]|nr:FAD-binding oxidoreductase [Candidatus Saccharimonadales bacterium]